MEARQRSEGSHEHIYGVPSSPKQLRQLPKDVGGGGPDTVAELHQSWTHDVVSNTTHRRRSSTLKSHTSRKSVADGFDEINVSGVTAVSQAASKTMSALMVLKNVKSIRGQAMHEYGKVHAALVPYYMDAVGSSYSSYSSGQLVYRTFKDPEQQALMFHQLDMFAKSDLGLGSYGRAERMTEVIAKFEEEALQEFSEGYSREDIDGKMKKYAITLTNLNGGENCIKLYVEDNHLVLRRAELGGAMDCIDYTTGDILLERTQAFFNRLTVTYNNEVSIVERAFPDPKQVISALLERVGSAILGPFLETVLAEGKRHSPESYLKAVPGTFAQAINWSNSIIISESDDQTLVEEVVSLIQRIFKPFIEQYLPDELESFTTHSNSVVEEWDRALSEQAESTESFLMSNINRQADKNAFLSSFKKVVMMPVNILPSFPTFSSAKPTAKALVNGDIDATGAPQTSSHRASLITPPRPSTPIQEAPTTELAAKAAIMNAKLEAIRSLFSIEVALDLVHAAKGSLERVAQFAKVKGDQGIAARQQCETIFVLLLQVLGTKHVIAGFDSAVSRLSNYNPKANAESESENNGAKMGLEPLVTFLELVNVGDLIMQMLDVFYEQELIGHKITDRSDFLAPANKEKKKFEQGLDERVAAGLNKGIDVLIAEVEYILATTQTAADYNPDGTETDMSENTRNKRMTMVDVGPSQAAKQVVDVITSHTKMLVGATDKSMLDVFNQEVGLRLFGALCKHLKRQRISVEGSIKLIRYDYFFFYPSGT